MTAKTRDWLKRTTALVTLLGVPVEARGQVIADLRRQVARERLDRWMAEFTRMSGGGKGPTIEQIDQARGLFEGMPV